MASLAQDKTLRDHIMDREGFKEKADKKDVDGNYYFGYGSHFHADGTPVKEGDTITKEDAADLLTHDIETREAWLAENLPRFEEIPNPARRALIDVAFGKKEVLSEKTSPKLREALRTAKTADELFNAVKEHYPTYRKANGAVLAGLETRRRLGFKRFFGEDYEYPEYQKLLDAKTHMRVGEDISAIGQFAKLAGITTKELKNLNPGLTDTTLEAGKLYRVRPDAKQDAKGGNVRADEAGGATQDVAPDADPAVSDKPPVEEREPSPEPSAPARIIINPKVFKDKRDGLCVAYNEAFRVLMEMNGFDPQAEPTEEQRKFFSDTAYADDERMLRRTILARICTFDDSVKNPTDEQLDEALEFLETVMEIGAPQSEEEQANVQRIHDMIAEIRKAPRPEEQPAEQPVESEAPPVAAVYGGSTRELRREQREQEVLDQYMARTAGRDFMADVGDGLRTEVGVEPSTEVSGEISRRAEEDNDEEEENNMLPRADIGGGKTGVPKGSAKTDDTYVTNTAVVMPEAEARKMGVVTQGFERVGKDQVAIPFEDFRSNGTVVDAAELLAESYGGKEAAEAAVAKSMANRAKRYPGGVPSEAAMADPESVPVVPAGARPGPWDEAYLSHAARAGHWNLKTVKSGAYLRTAGYIPGLSLGLIPTRVLGTSSPSIEVRRMLNSQVGETGESAGNGRIVTISDTANPNKPGWYASDEGYRAAALGSVKGWLTANGRMPGEGEDLAAVMAAAHRDRTGLKRGKIDKNGKDFLAAVAKAYEAERGGSASKKDKEILAAARDMDMWGQVVGARRYDRYSTTA